MKRCLAIFLTTAGLLLVSGCSNKGSKKSEVGLKPHPQVSALGEVFRNPSDGIHYVRMATIDGDEPNKRFRNLLSTFDAHMNRFNTLKKQLGETQDPAIKKELTGQLEKMIPAINQIKQKMKDAFGVTLDRPRLVVIEKSHLYLNRDPPKPPGGSKNVLPPAPAKQAPAMTPAVPAPNK